MALLGFSSAIEGFMGRAENNVGDFLGRVAYWKATLAGWGRSPILGLGLGGTEAAINRFLTDRPTSVQAVWSHNDYVQVFAELGLAGSAALLAGIACFGFRARLEWMEQGPALGRRLGGMRLAILAGLAMTLIHALFDFHLRLPLVGFQFLLLSALLLTGTKGMISRS